MYYIFGYFCHKKSVISCLKCHYTIDPLCFTKFSTYSHNIIRVCSLYFAPINFWRYIHHIYLSRIHRKQYGRTTFNAADNSSASCLLTYSVNYHALNGSDQQIIANSPYMYTPSLYIVRCRHNTCREKMASPSDSSLIICDRLCGKLQSNKN